MMTVVWPFDKTKQIHLLTTVFSQTVKEIGFVSIEKAFVNLLSFTKM